MQRVLECLVFISLCGFTLAYTVETACPKHLTQGVDHRYLRYFDGYCFYFDIFHYKTYYAANDTCDQLGPGGTLAIPKTKEINEFLIGVLAAAFSGLGYTQGVWIGMHDSVIETRYQWEDGSDVEWTNFAFGTGGLWGKDEDCISLDAGSGKWHDYPCEDGWWSASKQGYICQIPVPEITDSTFPSSTSESTTIKSPTTHSTTTQTTTNQSTASPSTARSSTITSVKTTKALGMTTETTKTHHSRCPPFDCQHLDCGMNGYRLDENSCEVCECNY